MNPFFDTIYFDNTVWQYTQFGLTIIAAFVLATLIHVTVIRNIAKFTMKTENRFDDQILQVLKRSVNIIALIAGIYFGRNFLTLTEKMDSITGAVLLVIIILEVARLTGEAISLMIAGYINRVTKRKKDVNKDLLLFSQRLAKIAIWVIALMMIINNLGYNISSLLAGLGLGGLAFALAAQQTLGNFFGSVSVIVDQPFQVGDLAMIDGTKGTVKRVGLRSTRLTTLDGTEVSIPNAKVASSLIENFSKRPMIKTKLDLGVEYSTTNEKMTKGIKIIEQILKKRKDISRHMVHFLEYADSALVIKVVYWLKYYPEWSDVLDAQQEVNLEIKKQFEKEKIEFAFPTQTVHLKK
jgi:MscS family membrane protein